MKLISTKEYLLLVSPGEILEHTYRVHIHERSLFEPYHRLENGETTFVNSWMQVIAYYPLTKEAKELDLPLLPNPYSFLENKKFIDAQEYALNKNQTNISCLTKTKMAWLDGFEAAQSKQFSLEDIKKAFKAGESLEYWKCMNTKENPLQFPNTGFEEDFIQSLSTQQLPKEFILGEGNTFEEKIKNGMYDKNI